MSSTRISTRRWVPTTAGLFEAVEGLLQSADEMRVGGVSGRLAHEDLLFRGEFPVEICALDVDLMNFHVLSSSER